MNFATCHYRLWLLFTVPVPNAPVAPALRSYDPKAIFCCFANGPWLANIQCFWREFWILVAKWNSPLWSCVTVSKNMSNIALLFWIMFYGNDHLTCLSLTFWTICSANLVHYSKSAVWPASSMTFVFPGSWNSSALALKSHAKRCKLKSELPSSIMFIFLTYSVL